MREENEIEKNENESEDGVVEHSKVQVYTVFINSQKAFAFWELRPQAPYLSVSLQQYLNFPHLNNLRSILAGM